MLHLIPIELTHKIYKIYFTNNVLIELKKINKRYNIHYLDWSIFEHIKYVNTLHNRIKKNNNILF